MHYHSCVSEGYRMSRTDTPPDASASQGDRTNLIILLPGSTTGSPVANEAGLELDTWARAPRWRVWQAAPPRRHGHPDGLRSAHLGSSPLVRGRGGGRREGAVRQD